MCNKDDRRPSDKDLDDPNGWGPPVFGPARNVPPGEHRGLFFALLGLPLLVLACQSKPGGREEDDPMHHRLQREGKTLRDQLGLGGNGSDRDKKNR